MIRTRRRGLSLAILLLSVMVISVVTAAVLTRLQQARHTQALHLDRTRDRYDSMSALHQVLERIRRGEDLSNAAHTVSSQTGREILAAGNRLLVTGSQGTIQASVVPRAWQHALLARELNLNGLRGAFDPKDPHGPALGTPPAPTADFLTEARGWAQAAGIHLKATAADCSFQPGGGTWQRTYQNGRLVSIQAGGTARWTLEGQRWTSDGGACLELVDRTWILSAPNPVELQGTLLVEETSLEIRSPLALTGELVVWNGSLLLDDLMQIRPARASLALAVLTDIPAAELKNWNAQPTPFPGDLLLLQGRSRLTVGDLETAEKTGGLVLASGRLVKRGGNLQVAGVVAVGRAELNGVPAGSLVWSNRIERLPPEHLESQDAHLTFSNTEVQVR
ncbi:MAG: hypothetical protein ACOX9B_11235 [Candidatus Xenobium sp.]|jgi:hypothetical protein